MPDLRPSFSVSSPELLDVAGPAQTMKKSESELTPGTYPTAFRSPSPLSPDYERLWAPGAADQQASPMGSLLRMKSDNSLLPDKEGSAIDLMPGKLSATISKQGEFSWVRSKYHESNERMEELLDDTDDVLQRILTDDVIDQLYLMHNSSAFSHDRKIFLNPLSNELKLKLL
jgi:hypothetical protein